MAGKSKSLLKQALGRRGRRQGEKISYHEQISHAEMPKIIKQKLFRAASGFGSGVAQLSAPRVFLWFTVDLTVLSAVKFPLLTCSSSVEEDVEKTDFNTHISKRQD